MFAGLAVGVAGIPLCVVVAPLLFALALVVAYAIDLVAPLSQAQWDHLRGLAFVLPRLWAALGGEPSELAWGTLASLYLVPGSLLMLVAYPRGLGAPGLGAIQFRVTFL